MRLIHAGTSAVALVTAVALGASFAHAQSGPQPAGPSAAPTAPRVASRTTSATRTPKAPVIDGLENDDIWRSIAPTRGFRQYDPGEDADPDFETEFRVTFDDHYLYALVRGFDPHPDSIARLLSRRDVKTNSDQLGIIIDGFHDRRNAVEFIVNPAGVKRDGVFYNDGTEDFSWDGVWDVAVTVDEKGWLAEFRVPFSQLRFAKSEAHTFGLSVFRDIARLNHHDAWPLYRRSVAGVASQLGTLEGIRGVPSARRIEVLPYAVSKSVPDLTGPGRGNVTQYAAGLDLKAGLGSNLTLDGTINPDFGQVESDPAILNLTAFETRFDEKRLFFQEGLGLFRCGSPCDGPFYTRRIGRTPQLRTNAGDPAFTSILGAGKVTGRFASGYTLAVLDAVTNEMHGTSGQVVEPQTNYLVMRIAKEARDGSRQVGLLMSDTRRQLNSYTDTLLRRSATMAMVQGSARFAQKQYEIMGYAGQSYVTGSAAAIARTQLNSVHYFQRPDGDDRYDPTRTSLFGGAIGGSISKIRGAVRAETFVRRSTGQQEMNDIGLVPLVGDMSIRQTISYQPLAPSRWIRSAFSQLSGETHWTIGGLPAQRSVTLHTSASLHNNWSGALTATTWDIGGINCVSCARGGPSVRQSPKQQIRLDISGDSRRDISPTATWIANVGDEGRTSMNEVDAGVNIRVASRFSGSIIGAYNRAAYDQQWAGNYGALLSDTTHFTFARLDQQTVAITTRMNWTATPTLSFQFYGQPFVTGGSYSNWRQLGAPRAPAYADRFRPYGGGAQPGGFNVKQFNSNVVVRWEYRPASTLFLVWQQGRFQDSQNRGSFDGQRDVHDLFSAPPQNTLLAKFSYWFNP